MNNMNNLNIKYQWLQVEYYKKLLEAYGHQFETITISRTKKITHIKMHYPQVDEKTAQKIKDADNWFTSEYESIIQQMKEYTKDMPDISVEQILKNEGYSIEQ
jgi:hypothetical protein